MSGSSRARFVIHVEGEPVEVELDAEGGASVGDARYQVTPTGDGRIIVRRADSSTQHVITIAGSPRPAFAHVDGKAARVEVQSAAEAALDAALGGGRAGAGSGQIKAPMPGRVVKLLVAVGDTVEVDAPVVIVEAMKMENELAAPVAGTVKEIHAAAGDAVDAGAMLLTIEAPEDDA